MSQDDLLRKLGQVAREEAEGDSWDERWDRLAAGTLSAEEETELRRLADTSEDGRLAYEAFRPLGEEFQARVVQRIAALRSREAESVEVEHLSDRAAAAVVSFPSRWRRVVTGWVAAAAAVAAMIVGIIPPRVPAFMVAELSGGFRTTRGDLTEEPRFAPGDECQAVLQPVTGVRRPSSLRTEAFLLRGAELRPLALEKEVDPSSGAVRVTATLDRDLPPGSWTLWLVVGRKGSLPGPAEVRTFSSAAPVQRRNWVALPKTLQIQPRAPD